MLVKGENVFPVNAHAFAISPSNEGYTLAYSCDGVNFTNYDDATPSGTTAIVNFAVPGMSYKLVGNNSDVYVQY